MSWPMDNTMKIVKNTVRIPLKPHSSSYALCLWYPYACAQQFWGLYVEFWANGGMKCVFPGLRRERPFRGENWQKNRNKFRPVDQTGPAWKKLVVSCKGDHVIAHTNLGVCMSPTSKNIFFCVFPIYFCLTNLDKPVPGPMKKYFPGNGNHHCNFLSFDMLFWQAFCYQPVVCEDNWVGAFTKKTETANASEKPRKKSLEKRTAAHPGEELFAPTQLV